METTILLTKLIGLYILILGLAIVLRRKMVIEIVHEIFQNKSLAYIVGIMLVIVGLLVVLNHNIWQGTVETIITVIGWLVLAKGLVYLFIPMKSFKGMMKMLKNAGLYYLFALAYLAFGAWLAYVGFFVM